MAGSLERDGVVFLPPGTVPATEALFPPESLFRYHRSGKKALRPVRGQGRFFYAIGQRRVRRRPSTSHVAAMRPASTASPARPDSSGMRVRPSSTEASVVRSAIQSLPP